MRRVVPSLLMLLVAIPMIAQKKGPWRSKACEESPACGIVVKFDPPLVDDLLVPNEVTVDVPLELHAIKVIVSSYPLGTEVSDIPSQGFAEMHTFQKAGEYARFRGQIKKCTDQGSIQVSVFCKGLEGQPITAYGMAIECKESGAKGADQPPPTK